MNKKYEISWKVENIAVKNLAKVVTVAVLSSI